MSNTETRDVRLAEAQRLRPEALQCVERLKAACREEARELRERAARTIAEFAIPLPVAPGWRSPSVWRSAEQRPR